MYPIELSGAGARTLLPAWWPMQQTFVGSHLLAFLLQAQVRFWLQILIVAVGTAWCLTMISTLCLGGWYAATHPTTGNDRVIQRLVGLLWFLTCGLTDPALPQASGEDPSRQAHREPEASAGSPPRS